ncbi:hypothetical protein CYA_0819 [Synechococcus sp. JA-3-3Ab]|nr:hypothetical protein CYA_0819 [Synechococcus sp. JA-3-3Ab]
MMCALTPNPSPSGRGEMERSRHPRLGFGLPGKFG